jgi:hypothetical protein
VIEALENRRLFAVGVSQGFPGFYEVEGDDAADEITVVVDQAARTVTVNGVAYGGAGSDRIDLQSVFRGQAPRSRRRSRPRPGPSPCPSAGARSAPRC